MPIPKIIKLPEEPTTVTINLDDLKDLIHFIGVREINPDDFDDPVQSIIKVMKDFEEIKASKE